MHKYDQSPPEPPAPPEPESFSEEWVLRFLLTLERYPDALLVLARMAREAEEGLR
ncbi:MAG: hypothetical protein L0Z62_33820 [Gemmataceae bacterium]|nr:hypothetical protein [Gemmataceae bacterium]